MPSATFLEGASTPPFPRRGILLLPKDIIRIMTLEEVRQMLYEKATKRFGKARADELRPDIEQTAGELVKVYEQTVGPEDEP